MAIKLLSFLLCCCCISLNLSGQTFSWAKGIGASSASGTIFTEGITVDYIGNVINTGTFYDSYDFDPGPGSTNIQSPPFTALVFIQKLNPSGDLIWVKAVGAPFQFISVSNSITENNGDVIIIGTFEGTIDFDPGFGVENFTATSRDMYVLKLDASGNFLWAKTMGGTDWTFTSALSINDGYLIGGAFYGTIDFDPDTNSTNFLTAQNADGFILRLSINGDLMWVKQFMSNGNAQVFSIKTDSINNIIFGGNFGGTTDFDPGPGIDTLSSLNPTPPFYPVDCFVGKLNSAGNLVWVNSYGGDNEEYLRELVLTSSGDIIINGTFNGTTDFDPGSSTYNLTAALTDIYFLKINSVGDFIWAKAVVGTFYAEVSRLVIDNDDYLYCTGSFENSVDFDLGSGVNTFVTANAEIFVLKIDTSGNTADIDILTGPDYEKGVAIAVDNNGNIYCNGYFENTMDFDPQLSVNNLTPQNNYKWMYTFQWKRCPVNTSSTINVTGCSFNYNGQVYSGNGTYIQLIQNSSGCDSIVTINLTESATNTYIDTLVCTGSYTLNGQTYTTSGFYTQFNTNIAGCDSNYYLNLVVGLSNINSIAVNSCDYYVTDQNIYNFSGIYTENYTNASGCDSTVIIDLTIDFSYNGTYTIATCDSFEFDGNIFTQSGLYSIIYTRVNGCDSIINFNLTITNSDTSITASTNQLTSNALPPATYQWITCPGYVPIIGETSQSFTPLISGSYAVIVNENNCSDTSSCYPIVVSGLSNSNLLLNNLEISPNPASDFINVQFANEISNFNLSLTSIAGQLLFSNEYINKKELKLDIGNFKPGLYFINIQTQQGSITTKFVKL